MDEKKTYFDITSTSIHRVPNRLITMNSTQAKVKFLPQLHIIAEWDTVRGW